MLDKLPAIQNKIIKEKFLKAKSCSEIAQELGLSRQSVNKIKNKALNILKTYYLKGDT